MAADMGRLAVGVDVGGSGIKVAVVDVDRGVLVGPRLRVATPQPSSPESVVPTIVRTVRRAIKESAVGPAASQIPIGVGMPAVVIDGVTKTAANIDGAWVEYDLGAHLRQALKGRIEVLNDADAAGLAEMRFGAGVGERGVVFVLTLGTGLGSGMFNDGVLVPNTELGHMEIRGRDAERRSAAVARTRRGLSWKAWAADLDEHLHAIDKLFWPNLIIIGGGVSKNADKFIPRLTIRPRVVPATLRNDAGIVGAAMAAAEHFTER
ncbi:MAG TPA: ROK family protein [Candidatus Limnocylindrales bacterium]|nr:ROK family protein [Candidatus Limnocylindrales bacterium]